MKDLPTHIRSRDGQRLGEVRGTRPCQLEGCTGLRLIVRWPEGHRTHLCTKSLTTTDTPSIWQLV